MALSLLDFIDECYFSRRSANYNGNFTVPRSIGAPTLDAPGPFRFLKVPLTGSTLELPCIYKYPLTAVLSNNLSNPEQRLEEFVLPLACLDNFCQEVKTSKAALKFFFYETAPYQGIRKLKVGSVNYYGGPGLLLYEDYTPLLMLSLVVKKNAEESTYTPIRCLIRINPIIYTNEDILAKYIRSKFLKELYSIYLGGRHNNMTIRNTMRVFNDIFYTYSFKVVIEDFSEFFIQPSIPDTTFTDEAINSLLKEGLPKILDSIK